MKENIVLIGMMGCGKTTIGISLSFRMKMPFLDIDKEIEKDAGMSISEIFEKYGEKRFREYELNLSKRVSKLNGYIISCGGGVVLNEQNMVYLKENSKTVYIHRSPDKILQNIRCENRPLLKENKNVLYKIYEDRHKLYLKYADIVVNNTGTFNEGVLNVYNAIKDKK